MPSERAQRRTRWVGFAVLSLLAGLVPPSFVAAADLTFTPAADAHVNSGNPSGNYGGLTTMKVREGSGSSADPAYRGYWRFTVSGLTGAAASVKLRLFVTDASANSQGVYPIANTTWTETGLTYANAPPITGSPLASRTAPVANAYVEFALPASAVSGNGPVAFAIKSAGTDSAIFATREVAATPPQLVVTPNAGPPPPVAEFTGSPTSGPVGQSVTFDSSASQGSGLTYAWSFGDGTAPPEASQANPVHQYTSAGTYTVALTVSNTNGSNTRTRPGYITIGNPPVASFTATPGSGTAPLLVSFNGTGSSGANLTYAWDFGDPASGAANTSTLPQPSHTYAAGSYQVRLTVSNVNGTSTSPPTTIAVTPPAGGSPIIVAPAADAQVYGSSPNTNYGSLATMRTREDSGASGTYRTYVKFAVSGTGGSVTALKLRLFVTDATPNVQSVYAVSDTTWTETGLRWSNAPPIVGSPLVSGPAPTTNAYVEFTLPATAVPGDGLYTFALKSSATNSAIFRSKEATTNRPQLVVTLAAPPPIGVPTAAFTSDRTSGQAPLAVQFTDQSTNGANAWSWDFGEPSSGSANVSTLRNPSHLYSTVGPHTVTLIASNGNGPSEPATGTITVDPATPGDPVFVGAGDIADCTVPQDEATATLLDGIAGTVFTAGDNAYPDGATNDFNNCYGPTWGRHKARTMPTAGNHEYQTTGAAGHFAYFGAVAGDPTKGYYSFDIGTWHAVMLNSNCAVVSCAAGSAQEIWLRADLAAHPATCTIAIWHHPRFSSGFHGNSSSVQAFWDALYAGGADVVVNGHDHDYERFGPQTPTGTADPNFGIREFIAGTGGKSLRPFGATAANSQVRDANSWGVLKLTLHASSYDYSFVPIAGQSFTDAGSGSCHGAPSQASVLAARAASPSMADAVAATSQRMAPFRCDIPARAVLPTSAGVTRRLPPA